MQATHETTSDVSMVYVPWLDVSPDEWFMRVVQANRDLRIERNAKGDLEIMSPTGGESGAKNSLINARLFFWAEQNGTGKTFDSSTGFRLPNGAIRSPDASWVLQSRLGKLSSEEMRGYIPLAPDFVIELLSPTDTIAALQAKMEEYLTNGTRLGWLIDPLQARLFVYRSDESVVELLQPVNVSGDPLLPGFTLDLTKVW